MNKNQKGKYEFTFDIKEKSYDNKLYYSWNCQEYIKENIRKGGLQTFEEIKQQMIIDLDKRDVILEDVNSKKIYCSGKNCLKSDDFIEYIKNKYDYNEKKNINNEKTLNFLACINQNIYSDSLIELIPLYYNYYGYNHSVISLKQNHFILENNILKTEFKCIFFILELKIMVDVMKINYVFDFNDNGKIEIYLSKRLISPLFTINYIKKKYDYNKKKNINNLNNDFITFLFSITNLSDIFLIENKEDILKLNNILPFKLKNDNEKVNLSSNNKSKNNINSMTMSRDFIKNLFKYYLNFNNLNINIQYIDSSTVYVSLGIRLIGQFNINITNNKKFIIQKTILNTGNGLTENNFKKIINSPLNENMFSMNRYILPYQKNNMNIVNESNLLIVSFNEANTKYNLLDTHILINKILMDNPLFVIINTQESLIRNVTEKIRGRIDFHGPFGKMMKLIEYEKLDEVSGGVIKAKVAIGINKNVRTSVYYDKKKVNSSMSKKSLFRSTKVQHSSNDKEINIIKCVKFPKEQYLKSTQSKLGTIRNSTWFKGSICYHLCFETSNGIMKFIFVNSHLFFESKSYSPGKDKSNTGLKKRIDNFESLIKEFDLIKKYNDGYNIFFCGDLNFRLTLLGTNTNTKSNFKEYLFQYDKNNNKVIIQNYLLDTVKKYLKKLISLYKKENSNVWNSTLLVKNEIKNFLESKKSNTLYEKFYESIVNLGTFITMKNPTKESKKQVEFIEKYVKNNKNIDDITFEDIKDIFKIYTGKSNEGVPRPPSMPDRILAAIHTDVKPLAKKDLKTYLFPDKSDHKMISLDVRLNIPDSNLNKLRKQLQPQSNNVINKSGTNKKGLINYYNNTTITNNNLPLYQTQNVDPKKINKELSKIIIKLPPKLTKIQKTIIIDTNRLLIVKPLYIFKSINNSNQHFTSKNKRQGAFGEVYYNTNKSLILKVINDSASELSNNESIGIAKEYSTLLFQYYLQISLKETQELKFLCEIYELGQIKRKIKKNKPDSDYMIGRYYCIMDNCGLNLLEYILKNNIDQSKMINIFIQCAEALKILHNLDFLHMDIKLENYVIKDDQVKIIDFGEIKKNGSTTDIPIGTDCYLDLSLYCKKQKNIVKLTKNMDIYSLGILYYVFNELNNINNNNKIKKKYETICKTIINLKFTLCKINNTSYNKIFNVKNKNLPNIIKKCLTHKYKDLNALIKDLNQIK